MSPFFFKLYMNPYVIGILETVRDRETLKLTTTYSFSLVELIAIRNILFSSNLPYLCYYWFFSEQFGDIVIDNRFANKVLKSVSFYPTKVFECNTFQYK